MQSIVKLIDVKKEIDKSKIIIENLTNYFNNE